MLYYGLMSSPAVTSVTFVTVEDTWTVEFDDYLESLGVPGGARYEDQYIGCECEQDWNCPLHANRQGTWIETRYEGDREEIPYWAEAREAMGVEGW